VLKKHCEWLENAQAEEETGLTVDGALAVVDSDDILDWIDDQYDAELSEQTIHNREVLVRGMYAWLTTERAGVRTNIPWEGGYVSRGGRNRVPRFVTTEQVVKLLNGMHNESQRVAAHFIYDTGVRVSELIRLTNKYLPDERDWPEEVNYYPMLIPGSKARGGKIKYRYTIISRPMLARVRRYHATLGYKLAKNWGMYADEKPTFLNVHGEKLTRDSVYKGIRDAWERQQMTATGVSPHRLRHGAAYSVLRSELGKKLLDKMLILKSMLGHASISTTEIYAAVPVAALESLCRGQQAKIKHAEADEIYKATYLPGHKHVERRGHNKG
jgi:integrase/recombinase XerD